MFGRLGYSLCGGLFASALLGSWLLGAPASGDNYVTFPIGGTGCHPLNLADNSDHTFAFDNVTDEMKNATNWVRTEILNPTVLFTSVVQETSNTHVVTYDRQYTGFCGYDWWEPSSHNGIIGIATCASLTGTGICQRHEIRYNTAWTNLVSVSSRRALACHENGHAVGIKHREAGCMPEEVDTDTPNDLTAHEINFINSKYPG